MGGDSCAGLRSADILLADHVCMRMERVRDRQLTLLNA